MMSEIHKSKTSFCEFIDNDVFPNSSDSAYHHYDAIVVQESSHSRGTETFEHAIVPVPYDISIITDEVIAEGKKRRATRITQEAVNEYLLANPDGAKKDVKKTLPADIDEKDLIFRVISYDHIPLAPGRKKKPKTVADTKIRVNFAPYKHYMIVDGDLKFVGRSHCKDDKFSLTHGNFTNKLAGMFVLLVNRYSQRANWRGYSYVDEMKGQALLQLSSMGLQFNEHKSANPFAYYTAALTNAFTRVFNTEKNHQNIRDDLLESQGQTASFSRQLAIEEEIRRMREVHDHVPGFGNDNNK